MVRHRTPLATFTAASLLFCGLVPSAETASKQTIHTEILFEQDVWLNDYTNYAAKLQYRLASLTNWTLVTTSSTNSLVITYNSNGFFSATLSIAAFDAIYSGLTNNANFGGKRLRNLGNGTATNDAWTAQQITDLIASTIAGVSTSSLAYLNKDNNFDPPSGTNWFKGHIGIRTNAPAVELHIVDKAGNVAIRIEADPNWNSILGLFGDRDWSWINDGKATYGTADHLVLYDSTAAAVRMYFDTSGNAGFSNRVSVGDGTATNDVWNQNQITNMVVSSVSNYFEHCEIGMYFTGAVRTISVPTDYTMFTNWYVGVNHYFTLANTNQSVVTTKSRTYLVGASLTHAGSGAGEEYEFCFFTNGQECVELELKDKTSGGDVSNMSGAQIVTVPSGVTCDMRVKSNTGATTMVIHKAQFFMRY